MGPDHDGVAPAAGDADHDTPQGAPPVLRDVSAGTDEQARPALRLAPPADPDVTSMDVVDAVLRGNGAATERLLALGTDDDPARWLWTVTVLTRAATDALGHIHDRTPLLLPPAMWDEWLDLGTTSTADVRSLLDAVPEPHLLPREVGPAVGNVRNDGPELVAPVG